MMTGNPYTNRTADGQRRATPRWFLDVVKREYDIKLDVCAEPHTAACERYYTASDDGLSSSWDTGNGWAWCNPPWAEPDAWLRCAATWRTRKVSSLVLLKCDPGTKWFRRHKHTSTFVRLITPRLNYLDSHTMHTTQGVTHNSCLWVFDGNDTHTDNTTHGPLVMRYWHVPRPAGAH